MVNLLVQKGRRQEAEAVRPRVAVRRKGMLTKRGNAHQERQKGRKVIVQAFEPFLTG
ncbi:MAG: hypothetical protein F6K17_07695 [Okeania sp. SIO3C4]|nr:hypothetical protein [Okeania sp. SIO3C4]